MPNKEKILRPPSVFDRFASSTAAKAIRIAMVKKSVKVYLEDNESQSSAAKIFFDTRLVLWSIVEAIDQTERQIEFEENELLMQEEFEQVTDDLPISFESSKEKKKKRRKKRKYVELSVRHRMMTNYKKNTFTTHRIQEDNIFYLENLSSVCSDSQPQMSLVQVIGLTSREPAGDYFKVRYLQSFNYEEVHYSDLFPIDIPLPENLVSAQTIVLDYINNVFTQVDEDCWYRLLVNKPEGVHNKYWDQRYRLFEKFDEGILLDGESWYSITYETIGDHIIQRCCELAQEVFSTSKKKSIANIIDGFSGCGGIAIHAAKQNILTVAVDIDEKKLRFLQNNAAVYGVENYVECVQDNLWNFLRKLSNYESFLRYVKTLQKLDQRNYPDLQPFPLEELFRYYPPPCDEDLSTAPLTICTDEAGYGGDETTMPPTGGTAMSAFSQPPSRSLSRRESEADYESKRKRLRFQLDSEEPPIGQDIATPAKPSTPGRPSSLIQAATDRITDEQPAQDDLPPLPHAKHSYQILQTMYDLVILSPPWGGPDYLETDSYDLRSMITSGDCYYLAALTAAVTDFFVLVIPRNTPNESISEICNIIHYHCRIENIYLNGKCKVKVVYFYRP